MGHCANVAHAAALAMVLPDRLLQPFHCGVIYYRFRLSGHYLPVQPQSRQCTLERSAKEVNDKRVPTIWNIRLVYRKVWRMYNKNQTMSVGIRTVVYSVFNTFQIISTGFKKNDTRYENLRWREDADVSDIKTHVLLALGDQLLVSRPLERSAWGPQSLTGQKVQFIQWHCDRTFDA